MVKRIETRNNFYIKQTKSLVVYNKIFLHYFDSTSIVFSPTQFYPYCVLSDTILPVFCSVRHNSTPIVFCPTQFYPSRKHRNVRKICFVFFAQKCLPRECYTMIVNLLKPVSYFTHHLV